MSIGLYDGHRSLSSRASVPEPPTASLVVHLHRNTQSCLASFSGSLTDSIQVTIDGLADLFAGEESVILDLSRADVADNVGCPRSPRPIGSGASGGSQNDPVDMIHLQSLPVTVYPKELVGPARPAQPGLVDLPFGGLTWRPVRGADPTGRFGC
jgi:hypothetical protein